MLFPSIIFTPQDLGPLEVFNPVDIPRIACLDAGDVMILHYLVDLDPRIKGVFQEYREGALVDQKFYSDLGFQNSLILYFNPVTSERLLKDTVFMTVGRIYGLTGSSLVQALQQNTLEEYHRIKSLAQRNLLITTGYFIPGEELSLHAINQLEKPIIWPVWREDCWDGRQYSRCLDTKLYYNSETLGDMLEGAALEADSADLVVKGNLVIGYLESINIKAKLELDIEGHLVVAGKISAGDSSYRVDGNFINIGEVKTTQEFAVRALNAAILSHISSQGSITINTVEDLVIETLLAVARAASMSTVSQATILGRQALLDSQDEITITVGNNAKIAGAYIEGNSVKIKSEGEMYIVPVEIYNEMRVWGSNFYYARESLKQHKTTIKATAEPILSDQDNSRVITTDTGSIVIQSGKSLKIVAPDFQGTNLDTKSGGKICMVDAIEWERETRITWGSKGLFGLKKWRKEESNFLAKAAQSGIKLENIFRSYSYEDLNWLGIDINAHAVYLEAGTDIHAAHISMLPSWEISEVEIITKERKFSFGFESSGIRFAKDQESARSHKLAIPNPTVIQVREEFIVYTRSGKFTYIQPELISRTEDLHHKGKAKISINAKEIELAAALHIETEYNYFNDKGIGIGFKAKGGEFAIKASAWIEESSKTWSSARFNQGSLFADLIEIHADIVKDQAILYHAEKMQINSRIIIHGLQEDVVNTITDKKVLEAGVKLGFRSNIGSILDNAKVIGDKNNYASAEGVISTAFRSWNLYEQLLTLLSKQSGFGVSGGLWFFASGEVSEEETEIRSPVPTIIAVEDLKVKSEELDLHATQIKTYRGYIKTKYMKSRAGEYRETAKALKAGIEIDIPIKGTIPPSIRLFLEKSKYENKVYLNSNIYVSSRLTLDIEMHADLQGIYVEAGDLEAQFNSLVLESMQNMLESKSYGVNLGIGFNSGLSLDSIGGKIQNRNRHVVDSVSALVGRDSACIVVSNALRLNGAMIVNAERDKDGKFTDQGELILKVGELFVQHIYDYDDGVTLKAAIDFTGGPKAFVFYDKHGNKIDYFTLNAVLGAFEEDGVTRSTVGLGNVEVGENLEELEKANRDVSDTQTVKTNYNIKPIFFYFSNLDTDALKQNMAKSPKEFIEGVVSKIKKDFEFLLPESEMNLQELENNIEQKEEELKEKYKKLSKEEKKAVDEYRDTQVGKLEAAKEEIRELEEVYEDPASFTQEKSVKTEILEKLAAKMRDAGDVYLAFAERYPMLAEFGLSALTVAAKTITASLVAIKGGPYAALIAGGGALIYLSSAEAVSFKIGEAIGPEVAEFVNSRAEDAAKAVKEADPALSDLDAKSIALGIVLGGIIVVLGVPGVKQAFKELKALKNAAHLNKGGIVDDVARHVGDSHKIDIDGNIQWHLDGLDPYEEALKGGKHAGIITKSQKMSNKEISKSIRTLEKRIVEHNDKIKNPQKYLKNYHNIDKSRVLIYAEETWPKEIRKFEEQIYILKKFLQKNSNG